MGLTAADIESITATVPGGARNIQDIYPLAPLQEGILFHHLLARDGDPYLTRVKYRFASRARVDAFLAALQAVVDRHDILRTAVLWEDLPAPLQVVWRQARLVVEEVALDPAGGAAIEQLFARYEPSRYRLDLTQAPLMRAGIALDAATTGWVMVLLFHHLAEDNASVRLLLQEVQAHLLGRSAQLPAALPYRNFVAQGRLGISREEHEAFFRQMLGDVDEPTVPFGLADVHGGGAGVLEARRPVDAALARRLRACSRAAGVTAASLCHLAFARVLGAVSARDDVVFGTVLAGRTQGGEDAERTLGVFINTLPVRIRLDDGGVQESVRRTHVLLAQLLRHEHASLVLAQRCSAVAAPAPLFSALLNYRHSAPKASRSEAEVRAWEGIESLGLEERTNYPFTVSVDDLGEGFSLLVQVPGSLDPQRVGGLMHTALASVVSALERTLNVPVHQLDVLPDAERHQLLVEWNDTARAYAADGVVHELIEARVRTSPDAVAVVQGDARLSYRELNGQANRLARFLRARGVRPDTRVALCVERSPEMVVGLLAVLKAGGAFVPLDPSSPAERLRYMFEDSAPAVVLTHAAVPAAVRELLRGDGVLLVDLRADAAQWEAEPAHDLERGDLSSEHLAYVIYTSGSTGRPKGVMIEHRGAVNLYGWFASRYMSPSERVFLISSYAFDLTLKDIFGTLAGGAGIVLGRPELRLGSDLLADMESGGITFVNCAPGQFYDAIAPGGSNLVNVPPSSLKTVYLGGEQLLRDRLAPWLQRSDGPTFINGYGPTEITDTCSDGVVELGHDGPIPIGRPIANTQIYLLDSRLQPVPIGVTGEIYVGGAGVARGYLNRPELTAERFVGSPFKGGERLYKSGDLARYRPDGNLEFVGRNDFQVKLRGFRIELGEIEARLAQHPLVGEAVVLARDDAPGGRQLVAYYTPADAKLEVGSESLRAHLQEALPEYMVPAAYVGLTALPRTIRGKLDRKALPAPDGASYVTREYEPPRGEVECTIARVWSDLLKLERVGRNDDFFELGGHSLLAIRVVSQLRLVMGASIRLTELFAHPVLSDLARVVGQVKRSTQPAIPPADRGQPLALSSAQQRLWILAQMDGFGQAYHMPLRLRLSGQLDRQALRRALDRIVARHESLRTTFGLVDGEPVQRIADADRGFGLVDHDLRDRPQAALELERLAVREATAPFDLSAGPLIRGRLVRLAGAEHVLLVTMHHIVSDGWSIGILLRELSALYRAYREGQPDPLPAPALQYADYAAWQRRSLTSEVVERHVAYWQRTLAGAPPLLELPLDRPRPALQELAGARLGFELDAQLSRQLDALSRRHGTTLFMTLLTAWGALLARLSGQDDLVVGVPFANRTRAEVENLIGFFINTLALRLNFSDRPSVSEMLRRVKEQTLAAQENQDLPFEHVVEITNPPRSLAHTPLFQTMFVWQNAEPSDISLAGLHVAPVDMPYDVAKFDLTLFVSQAGDGVVGSLEYATALFDHPTAQRYLGYLRQLLEAMVSAPEQRIDRIALLSGAERHRLLVEWNDTAQAYPRDRCIHELFEAQAAQSPDAIAVVHEDARLSYGELNRQANRLARFLRGAGVGPGARVALCLERSIDMVVGLLGVLKAGGCYVPLDPAYPLERLAFMLGDSAPSAVLAHGALAEPVRGMVRSSAAPVIDMSADASRWADESARDLDRGGPRPADLAYIIYTSGSTGTPKGVMIEHRNVTNYIAWATASYAPGGGSVVSTPIAFDATVTSLLVPLGYGSTVRLLPERGEVEALEALVGASPDPGLIKITPSHLDALGRTLRAEPLLTNTVVIGGEALLPATVAVWRRVQPGVRLVNEYGPTEAAVGCITYDVQNAAPAASLIPIGRPVANTRIYILDAGLEPVPTGVTGELYIGGAQVGRGYLNQPELTAERFIASPFVAGDRLYKTGDMARYLPEGDIEFLGRADFQVKIRGFRVELGEIEARVAQHPSVGEAVVLAREDAPGEKRLVAYYTRADAAHAVSAESLRAHAQKTLPEYMVPAAYVELAALPLTPNGKLDRKALPAPQGASFVRGEYAPPAGELEREIARIWSDVLKFQRAG